jgi:hypothetical protein
MQRDPASRYRSAREFAADLEAFIRGGTVSARPTTLLNRLPLYARRHLTPSALVLIAITFTTLALVVRTMDNVQEVRAGLDPMEVRDTLRRALLWEYTGPPSEGERLGGESNEPILAALEARVREDGSVLYPRAHLHLAVLAAERGDEPAVARHLEKLESAGWEYETMAWIRDSLSSGNGLVRAPSGREPESFGNDVDRFYLLRGLARTAESGVALQTTAGLEKHPIYGASVLFLEALGRARREPPDLAGAIESLHQVLALVPQHPVVVAELLNRSCEYVRRQGWERSRAEGYLAPLAHLAADSTARQTVHAGLWTAYGNLLEELGDVPAARIAFARGSEEERLSTDVRPGEHGATAR